MPIGNILAPATRHPPPCPARAHPLAIEENAGGASTVKIRETFLGNGSMHWAWDGLGYAYAPGSEVAFRNASDNTTTITVNLVGYLTDP